MVEQRLLPSIFTWSNYVHSLLAEGLRKTSLGGFTTRIRRVQQLLGWNPLGSYLTAPEALKQPPDVHPKSIQPRWT